MRYRDGKKRSKKGGRNKGRHSGKYGKRSLGRNSGTRARIRHQLAQREKDAEESKDLRR